MASSRGRRRSPGDPSRRHRARGSGRSPKRVPPPVKRPTPRARAPAAGLPAVPGPPRTQALHTAQLDSLEFKPWNAAVESLHLRRRYRQAVRNERRLVRELLARWRAARAQRRAAHRADRGAATLHPHPRDRCPLWARGRWLPRSHLLHDAPAHWPRVRCSRVVVDSLGHRDAGARWPRLRPAAPVRLSWGARQRDTPGQDRVCLALGQGAAPRRHRQVRGRYAADWLGWITRPRRADGANLLRAGEHARSSRAVFRRKADGGSFRWVRRPESQPRSTHPSQR